MPTYDYRCPKCHTQFQANHAMTAEQPACPACGTTPNKVILSAPSVHGQMAQGREKAIQTFEAQEARNAHGPGCPCCH
jgi:putative FmdB family regulatory protein